MIDYKKLKISDTNRIKEQQIIDRIGQCIDDGFSWIFNAGAGSGKTYVFPDNRIEIVYKVHDLFE